ncbi:ATPase domain-containing protein [Polymorphobacter fuscus]|uniref:non-specific serine/threonine protein kinase n=1 Tax=Sandarakinorhabdus fusca TaxID=1439888 RepID=A0A7C9GXN7_9SPHN|nr:ATPase domain-containing protein [Polymorphobacter fuscus]KAB7646241.1 AAA family ATPase [Polymorphobacter fuscus]MQT17454.1 AAA family ATPase [Polymorphobacter fuscus]NJC10009.1 circadian clock protein KaiC [Polymorphobacter fuscus]
MTASDADLAADASPVTTGLDSLDYILSGGYAANRCHLIEGQPGSGKTTLAMQFLIAGQARGEKCLFITISESPFELLHVARSHGLSLDGIDIVECVPPELSLDPESYQSIVHASELELGETVRGVMAAVVASRPTLVVLDSLSEVRLLAQGALRYRRQVLALKHFFFQQNCTVLLLDDLTVREDDLTLHSIAHGVVRLEQLAMDYGAERRRLRVFKMRGRAFHGGFHDFVIAHGGLNVFPRLIASDDVAARPARRPASTGIAALDSLTGGGLDEGTTTLIQGPSGTGKSTLALQCVRERLERGETVLFVSFEETVTTFRRRAASVGIGVEAYLASGVLRFVHVDPAETSAGQISDMVRNSVRDDVTSVILDSLSGYQHALRDEHYLLLHMHELLTFLNQQAVVTIVVLAQAGVVGTLAPPFDMTYLADTVLLLRFFEAGGEMRRAVSVIKKRIGSHERMMRELFLDSQGVQVGPALPGFQNIMSSRPIYTGSTPLLQARDGAASA